MSIAEQCAELERQIEVLEADRQAIAEESAVTLKANEDVIADLKETNSQLRQQTRTASRTYASPAQTQRLQKEISTLRSQVDALGHEKKKLRTRLDEIQSAEPQLTDAVLEEKAAETRIPKQAKAHTNIYDTALTKKKVSSPDLNGVPGVTSLETRVGEISMKIKEAETINEAYRKIRAELQASGVNYDTQLESLRAQVQGKDGELSTAKDLSGDASISGVSIEQQIFALTDSLAVEREERAATLADKKAEISRVQAELNEAQAEILEMLTSNAGAALGHDSVEREEEAEPTLFKDYYQRIVQVLTGVSDPYEFAKTCQTQEQEGNELRAKVDELIARQAELKEQLNATKRQNANLQFELEDAGSGAGIEGISAQIEDQEAVTYKLKEKSNALGTLLKNLTTALEGMADKLVLVRLCDPPPEPGEAQEEEGAGCPGGTGAADGADGAEERAGAGEDAPEADMGAPLNQVAKKAGMDGSTVLPDESLTQDPGLSQNGDHVVAATPDCSAAIGDSTMAGGDGPSVSPPADLSTDGPGGSECLADGQETQLPVLSFSDPRLDEFYKNAPQSVKEAVTEFSLGPLFVDSCRALPEIALQRAMALALIADAKAKRLGSAAPVSLPADADGEGVTSSRGATPSTALGRTSQVGSRIMTPDVTGNLGLSSPDPEMQASCPQKLLESRSSMDIPGQSAAGRQGRGVVIQSPEPAETVGAGSDGDKVAAAVQLGVGSHPMDDVLFEDEGAEYLFDDVPPASVGADNVKIELGSRPASKSLLSRGAQRMASARAMKKPPQVLSDVMDRASMKRRAEAAAAKVAQEDGKE